MPSTKETQRKTIVVIGAGFFGIWTANKFSQLGYRVVLVSKASYAYFLVSSIRVAVDNDTEGTMYPLTEIVDAQVEIVKDEVVMMDDDKVSLKSGKELSFDVLVIATGARWADPLGTSHSIGDGYADYFAKEHKKIEEAKHIVLVGGGFNNAELAGEMHDRYKAQLKSGEKKITIIHSREVMMPSDGFYCDKLRKRVTEFFQKETDIEVLLNTRAEFSDEDPHHVIIGDRVIEADLIYHSTGTVASVPPHRFENFTNEAGFIKVHETWQSVAAPRGNVFVLGDCADFKYKGIMIRREWTTVMFHNIEAILKDPDTPQEKLKTNSKAVWHVPAVVSLGQHAGCGQLMVWHWTVLIPEWVCRQTKSKDLTRPRAKEFFISGWK